MIIIALLIAFINSKLLVKDNLNNECRHYIPNVDKDTKIIIQTQYWDVINIWIDYLDLCLEKDNEFSNKCKKEICEVRPDETITVKCNGLCQFSIGITSNEQILEIDQESFLITQTQQTIINFQVNQVFKHIQIESELLNNQKDHQYFNYSMLTMLNQTIKYSKDVRRLSRIIQLEEKDYELFKDKKIKAQIIIDIPIGAALKLTAIGYNEIREIELLKVIDDELLSNKNQYLLNINNQHTYYQNKGIFIKIISNNHDDQCRLSINQGNREEIQEDLLFQSEHTYNSEIFISLDQIKKYGNVYLISVDNCFKVPKTYTLKTYVEGLRQEIECRETVEGMILPNQKINNFILNIDNLDITQVVLSTQGNINLNMIECDSLNNCEQVPTIYNQHYYINQMKQTQIEIESSTNQTEQFQFNLICLTPPIHLYQDQLHQYISLEKSSQIYYLSASLEELPLIESLSLQIFKEYGEISFENDYQSTQWNFSTENYFQLQSKLDVRIQCDDPCSYQIIYKINRKFIDKIDYNAAQQLTFSNNLNYYLNNTYSFKYINTEPEGLIQLNIFCEKPLNLTLQFIQEQNYYYSFDQLDAGNSSRLIPILNLEIYGVLKTNITQFIKINITKIKIIEFEDAEYTETLKPRITSLYTYRRNTENNLTLIIDSHRKDIKISVCIKEAIQIEANCKYEDIAVQHLISLSQSDEYIYIYLTSNYAVDYTIKLQDSSKYFTNKRLGRSKQLFIENQNQFKFIQSGFQNSKKSVTVNLNFQYFIPFMIYCSVRNEGIIEFPSEDNYDYKELLYTTNFVIPIDIEWPQNLLMLFVFPHQISQIITIELTTSVFTINYATLSYLFLKAETLTYFQILTQSIDIPQIIFEFTSIYPAYFLLKEGCSKRPDQSEIDQGYDLRASPIASIHNIKPQTCYIGTFYSDINQTISFRWDQQNYSLNTISQNQIHTFFIHQNESYIDIIYGQPLNITIISDSIIQIQTKPYIYSDSLIDIMNELHSQSNQTQSCQYCPIEWDPKLPTTGDVIHHGLIVKINDNFSNYYTVISETYDSGFIDIIDEAILTKKLNKNENYRINRKANLSQQLYLRSLKGQLLLILNYQNYQIQNQMQQFEITEEQTFIELIPQSQEVQYELQIKSSFPLLKLGQLYMSQQNKQRYMLPVLKEPQFVEIGFNMHHHNVGDCQEIMQLFKRQNLVFESKSINGGLIQDFKIDNDTYYLDVTINCYPEMHEGYYLYLRSLDSNMIMIILNTKLKFNSQFLQTQIFFIDIEYEGLYIIEIKQLQGSIVASSTLQLNQLYNGTNQLKTQKLENYYYKLLIDVESLGQLYFSVECFTQSNNNENEKCEYLIEIKQINSLSLEIQDIKIGNAIVNNTNLLIYQSYGIGYNINTIKYLIYYDKLTDNPNKQIDFISDPVILQLNDFHGETLYIEAIISYNEGEYKTKILYDPIYINTNLVQQSNQDNKKSYGYILIVTLLVLILLLIIIIFVYRYKAHILKLKLEYEKNDMRKLATLEVEMPDQPSSN